jgi:sigma54-dependent transcription regulator
MNRNNSHTLVSWIGGNDLKAGESNSPKNNEFGPIVSTLKCRDFDNVELLYNYPKEQVKPYLEWLKQHINIPVKAHHIELSSPVNFGEIYVSANKHLSNISDNHTLLSVLLSPGTPAMQAVWILLGKTRYPCTFLQSSLEQGVQEVAIPM